MSTRRFNPPPSWPPVPAGWEPPTSWVPPSDWPALPAGWSLWIEDEPIDPVFASEDVPPPTTDATASSPVADSQLTVTEIERDGVVFVVLPVGTGAGSPVVTIPRSSWTGGSGDRPTVEPSEVQDRAIGSRSTERAVVDPRDQRIASLEAEVLRLRSSTTAPSDGAVPLDDQQVLQSVGIYRYHHPLENAVAYKDRLTVIEAEIAALVREGRAIERSNMFTFDNSLAKGRKMSDDLSKLMLRAYNAEADNAVRSLRAGNVETAKRRLEKSREAIARLGAMMEMRIAAEYHDLRVEEVELTSDWLMRKQEERELERDERARLREEKRVQQELEAERERLDKERALIEQTIERLRENGEVDAVLEARLGQIDAAIQQNDFRAANIRAGYVYVISNRGAFGPDVVKIGLTRRLEPSDRVNELGGASVPFRFDVHTIYFSEDAVSLETELHRHFASRALNQANPRKEFFFATPAEVREVLMQKVGALLEFREDAEATEYLQSVGAWPVRAA